MNYAATLMNCVLIGFTDKVQLNDLIGEGTDLRNITILVAVEHIILVLKYIISELIDDVPEWIA
jgi:anoctamin-8